MGLGAFPPLTSDFLPETPRFTAGGFSLYRPASDTPRPDSNHPRCFRRLGIAHAHAHRQSSKPRHSGGISFGGRSFFTLLFHKSLNSTAAKVKS